MAANLQAAPGDLSLSPDNVDTFFPRIGKIVGSFVDRCAHHRVDSSSIKV